jgi:DNA-binding beta-propeller fold protein YncE
MNYRWCSVCCTIPLAFLIACSSAGSGSSAGPGSGSGPATETSAHPPIRTQYRRTDLQYNPNALQFFPPHITAYDAIHKRVFISNTTQNRLDVFDATQESQIGSITVPLPWGMDMAPDGSKLYVATTFGDVYLIDPGAMQVVQRYPSSTIGSQGFIATQAFILADGQLALLGALGGFFFDGSPNFAIWNPATNALTVVNAQLPTFGENIGQMAVTADRTKVLVGGATAQYTELYDPANGAVISVNDTCGSPEEILPTPDGKRIIVVGLSGNVEVLDATTLAQLGEFPNVPGYSAVLSPDGSTLYTVDLEANVLAWDSTTFTQIGWVPSFDVSDLQQAIVVASIDETGLIFGPVGHGVAFLDSTKIQQGTKGTQFNIGFLSPPTGPLSGGTGLQAEVLTPVPVPNITTGTVYIGNASATNISLSPNSFTGGTPPSSKAGPADFTAILPDSSMRLMPENFSYGPTIVQVSTNAASAEGGAQGVIYGYGFDSSVQVTVGGQPATVTQFIPIATPTIPYPFPMEGILFTMPGGIAGTAADVTVQTANGTETASNAIRYVPAVQTFPLASASLMQGIYDPHRSVLYFTDSAQIDVFSPASESWLAPIPISFTNANSRLTGIALSPDGNTLAISDTGNSKIYVLNPSNANSDKAFSVNTGNVLQPYGLAMTNAGAVYYATRDQSNNGGFNKLDTNTGSVTSFQGFTNGDQFVRVLLTSDGSHVFVNEGVGDAGIWVLNTADDSLVEGIQATDSGNGDEDAALSGDGSILVAQNLLMDDQLNVFGDLAFVDRDVWLPLAVFGEKLNSDGSLLFQPFTNGIDAHDGSSGVLKFRVVLPLQAANVYDAMAIDNTDGLLFVITLGGIAQVNFATLPTKSVRSRQDGSVISRSSVALRSTIPATQSHGRERNWLGRPQLRHLPEVRE